MPERDSLHRRLQQHVDCQLETRPRRVLEEWEQSGWQEERGTDVDEAPLKLMALYLLDAIEGRAVRLTVDKDEGVTIYADETYNLPKAPPHFIARGLEILREIMDMKGPKGQSTLALGIRNDRLELIIQKDRGLHVITMPGVRDL